MSLGDAAVKVLTEAGEPLHYREITRRILDQGLAASGSRTPDASVNAVIVVEIKRGKASRFVRVRPGEYGLRSWQAPTPEDAEPEEDEAEHRVRIPLFPLYSELRLVLPVWDGRPRAQITHLRTTLKGLRGTPQEPEDWTSPDEWIPQRLGGDDRELAHEIWKRSRGKVNPRHVYGHWLTACNYDLLTESGNGRMALTSRGKDFVKNPGGAAEMLVDAGEGMLELLEIVARHGPARLSELVEDWGEYVSRWSRIGTANTIRGTLRLRLRNLLDRKLISRSTAQYSVTDAGLAYLKKAGGQDDSTSDEHQELMSRAKQIDASVREAVLDLLRSMDPFALEHLVKRLLEEMGYTNVKVTPRSNDKGVDVEADIELGITSVHEVVQVKRHNRTIQRKDLDALRGSLHRFNAVRGTLITTGEFSSGTRGAAFEPGVAPITLINGEKLVDLLLEHGIGVNKVTIDVLKLDHTLFAGRVDGGISGTVNDA